MPRVPDETLNIAIYLYASEKDALAGERAGGAGFFLSVDAQVGEPLVATMLRDRVDVVVDLRARDMTALTGRYFMYAVTNAHVAARFPVVRLNAGYGRAGTTVLSHKPTDWVSHESKDLAVCLVEFDRMEHEAIGVGHDSCLTEIEQIFLDIGVGDDVYTVGRFINQEGRQRNSPTIRMGNIAMTPDRSEGLSVKEVPAVQYPFLIETRTVPGYSGSPVILNIPPWELAHSGGLREALGAKGVECWRLLGVVGGWVYGSPEKVRAHAGQRLEVSGLVEANSGMMWCVPAWGLLELLNYPDLRTQRQALRARWEKAFQRP